MIPCITLRQPWAHLLALGEKRVETRSWPTRFRGVIGIHASRRLSGEGAALVTGEPFRSSLARAGISSSSDLPLGYIVGLCRVVNCVPQTPGFIASLSPTERAFGDYADGRWAWLVAEPHLLPCPIPARGRLGIWTPSPDIGRVLDEAALPLYPDLAAG